LASCSRAGGVSVGKVGSPVRMEVAVAVTVGVWVMVDFERLFVFGMMLNCFDFYQSLSRIIDRVSIKDKTSILWVAGH